jgi:hypothetical protein
MVSVSIYMQSTCRLHAVRWLLLPLLVSGPLWVRTRIWSQERREAMLTLEFTEAEAQVVADVIVAWGADDCPVGAIDTQVLLTASDKLAAALDGQAVKAA